MGNKKNFDIKNHEEIIINLKKKFKKTNFKIHNIFGSKTILSNMADWNPAEMIGNKPSKLAISIYSELITNSIWSQQRYNYGYKNVAPNRLMIDMAGTPYIDLKIDLNSFIPATLNKSISNKIIYQSINTLKSLRSNKIEFKVIILLQF